MARNTVNVWPVTDPWNAQSVAWRRTEWIDEFGNVSSGYPDEARAHYASIVHPSKSIKLHYRPKNRA